MSSFDTISDDVHELVLRTLLSYRANLQEAFKHNLLYLSICQKWRNLALPMVYKNEFITYYDDKVYKKEVLKHPVVVYVPGFDNNKIITNMYLAQELGCLGVIRHVQITINYLKDPFPGMGNVVMLLENISLPSRVKSLNISMVTKTNMRSYPDEINIASQVAVLSKCIGNNMPEIKQLSFNDSKPNKITQTLYSQIAEHYSGQLENLICRDTIKISSQCVFTQLKNAVIDIGLDNEYTIPTIHADKLKTLQLWGKLSENFWNSFIGHSDNVDITFSNMHELILCDRNNFRTNSTALDANINPQKLVFPKLTDLTMDIFSDYTHLLNRMVLPSHIEYIAITTCSSTYKVLSKMTFAATKSIELSTTDDETDNSVISNMNRIFRKSLNCRELSLVINSHALSIGADDISCTALTSIDIAGPTSVSTLISLIVKLPKLIWVDMGDIVLDDALEAINIPRISLHKQQPMLPFKSEIKYISLYYRPSEYPPDVMIQVVIYCLLKMPKLKWFGASQIPSSQFLEKLQPFKSFYPHINNVELGLDTQSIGN